MKNKNPFLSIEMPILSAFDLKSFVTIKWITLDLLSFACMVVRSISIILLYLRLFDQPDLRNDPTDLQR